MKIHLLKPRYLVALFIGLGSASILYALLIKSDGRFAAPFRPPEPQFIVSTGTVQDGDVFAVLLARKGVPAAYEAKIEHAMKPLFNPRFIQPGHSYEVITSTSGEFQKFVYKLDAIQAFTV